MHVTLSFLFLLLAAICYGLAAFSVPTRRFQGVPAGHACVVLAFIVGGISLS